MKVFINRWRARIWLLRNSADQYQRRAYVENRLRDVARGARDIPTREECREWALRLGIPTNKRIKP